VISWISLPYRSGIPVIGIESSDGEVLDEVVRGLWDCIEDAGVDYIGGVVDV
jgi:thiamine monophosphate kinase